MHMRMHWRNACVRKKGTTEDAGSDGACPAKIEAVGVAEKEVEESDESTMGQ